MKIAILGASGRVGKLLVNEVLESNDTLAGCYVSEESNFLGQPVAGSSVTYQSLGEVPDTPADLLVDFSTPSATLRLLENAPEYARALVIGTTGLEDAHQQQLQQATRNVPVIVGANFAQAFEPFVVACKQLSAAYPETVPSLSETYHDKKKAEPSGTSLRLIYEITQARQEAGAAEAEIPLEINRVGDAIGSHSFHLDTGATLSDIEFKVTDRNSFARGALSAGHWVVNQPAGLYVPADIASSN